MGINLAKARLELERLDGEIAERERQLGILQQRHADLVTFLTLAEEYKTDDEPDEPAPPITKPSPGAAPQPAKPVPQRAAAPDSDPGSLFRSSGVAKTPPTLRRDRGNRQTIIALEMLRIFEPGNVLTNHEVADRLDSLPFNPPGRMSRAHFLSSFVSREADATNGILERLESGKGARYRVRENARALVEMMQPDE